MKLGVDPMLHVLTSLRQFAVRSIPLLVLAVTVAEIGFGKMVDKASPLMH